ncbi:cupin [Microvirga splendida]|uniref:Cupin n=1 Tax=Microvirga splendida TaxID=2795727 RepID=A0ABS0XZQ8_9HYPH|nr:cupin [Microvirga splendida]MBJ6125542.1 cupin [Microvirga splendida]
MALNHVKSGEIVDLRPLGERLPGAKTTALAKTEAFEAIRLVVPAGRDIAPYEVAGPITLHCLEGRVVLELPDAGVELSAGQWIYLDGGVRHALKGLENSSLLLTILFDP